MSDNIPNQRDGHDVPAAGLNEPTALERARAAQARINTHPADIEQRLVAVRQMLPIGARQLGRDLVISRTAAEDLIRRAKGLPRRACRAPGPAGLERDVDGLDERN